MSLRNVWLDRLVVIALVVLLLPLAVWAVNGVSSRFIADDYCTAALAREHGLIGSVSWWYYHWAGTPTTWVGISLAGLAGPAFSAVSPALTLLAWLGAAIWAQRPITARLGLPRPGWLAAVLAAVIVFATFDGAPSLLQSLYWAGAVIPYTWPLALLLIWVGYGLRALPRAGVRAHVITGLLLFLAGGLAEVYVALQIAALGLMALAVLAFAPPTVRRPALGLLATGLAASLLAAAVILLSPGNAARAAQFPNRAGLLAVAAQTLVVSLSYGVIAIGVFAPAALLTALVVPGVIAFLFAPASLRPAPRLIRRLLALSAAAALLLVMACLGPPLYAMSTPPSARIYFLAQFVLTVTAAFWGVLMGLGARGSLRQVTPSAQVGAALLTAVALIIGPGLSVGRALAAMPDYQTFAAEWDAREAIIQRAAAAGERQVSVQMLRYDIGARSGLDTLEPDPRGWVNQCAARYYGVDSITAETLLHMADKSG